MRQHGSDSAISPKAPRADSANSKTSHFTREPWWLVPLAGLVVAALTLWKFNDLQYRMPNISLTVALITAAGLGSAGAAVLVLRSHVRSVFWSNVILWFGIVTTAMGICVVSILTT